MGASDEALLLWIFLLMLFMKTIAFDLDGTLIDVSERDYRIYADILLRLGYSPISKDEYWPLRRNMTDIHHILSLSGLVSEEDVSAFLKERKALMEAWSYLRIDKPFDDVKETLSRLNKEYNLIILTKRYNSEATKRQMSELGFNDYAGLMIVTDSKEEAMRRISGLYAMVGDTENDIVPANSVGIKSIAVTTGIRNVEKLCTYNPCIIVNSLSEVIQYL